MPILASRAADPPEPRAPRAAGLHWLTLSLLVLAGIVNFLDRSSLAVGGNAIRSELHLSGTQLGALLSAFSLAYGIAQLPVGVALDRFGPWTLFGAGLGLWSMAQAITAAVGGMGSFLALRVLLGAAEAPFFPSALKIVRERFDLRLRGRAIAAVNVSTTLGQGLAPPFLTWLLIRYGWRPMFALVGGAGVLLALIWFAVPAPPDEATATTSQEDAAAVAGEWLGLFRSPTIWGLMLGFGGVNYTSWFFIGWLPTYLQNARGVTLAGSGWLAALPFLAGAAGMDLSGVVADLRIRREAPPMRVHRSQILTGMVVSAICTLLAMRAATLAPALVCICGSLFSIHFAGTSAWGFVQAASPRRLVATVGSVQNFGSFVIASAGPLLTGRILDRTHSFAAAFALCAAVALAGAASYAVLVRERPLDPIAAT